MNRSTLNSNAIGGQMEQTLSELIAAMPIVVLFNAVRSALQQRPSNLARTSLQASSR